MGLRQHAVTLAMIAAALGVGTYLWLDRDAVTSRDLTARKHNVFPAFRRDELAEVRVERAGATFSLVRHFRDAGADALWQLAVDRAPEQVADQPAVDRFVGTLESATFERRADDSLDRAQAGLDAPRAKVTLRMGGLVHELLVGKEAPAPPGAVYAELRGVGILVLPRDVARAIEAPADDYRARTIVPYLSPDLARIELVGEGGSRVITRGPSGGWQLDGSPRARVDRDEFDRVLTAFADLRAEAFVSDADADAALAGAKIALTMVPTDASRPRAVIELGGPCPGHPEDVVALRREPTRFAACVGKGIRDVLAVPAERLADRHAFSAHADEIEELSLVAGEQRLELARQGEKWHERAPAEGVVEGPIGNGIAKALRGVVADELVASPDLDALGLKPPRATAKVVRLRGDARERLEETVELGALRGSKVAVRRQEDGVVMLVERDMARAFEPSTTILRSTRLLTEQPRLVRALRLDGPAGHQALRRNGSGMWEMTEPAGFVGDGALAADLAAMLAELSAERWVADRDDGTFGLAKPAATIEMDMSENDGGAGKTIRLRIGGAAPGGSYASLDGEAGVFVLPRAFVRMATEPLVDRGYFLLDPAEIVRVELHTKARTLVLVRTGDRLEPTGEGASTPREVVDRLAERLSELRAEGTVHVGPARKEEGFDEPRLDLLLQRKNPAPDGALTLRLHVGAGDVWDGTSVFYVRREGVNATFAVAQSRIRPLLDAL